MIKTVTLGEICDISSGGTPNRSKASYFGGDIPWAKISDIEGAKGGLLIKTEEHITDAGLANINNRIFEKGTLLLAIYGSVGKVAIAGIRTSTNQAILGIRPKNEKIIDIQYLKHWFSLVKHKLLDRAVGGTLQNISLGIVKALLIPLPPLPRQRQIAAILDRADALRQKDRQLLAYYDQLAQSTFMDLFGDPVRNEKGWPIVKTGSIIDKIVAGDSYGGDERPLKTDELGVLKVSAVTSGHFRPHEYKAIPKSAIRKKVIFPQKGDLLFSRANTRELVAATCIVDKDYDHIFLPDKLWRLELNQDRCNPFFLKTLLSQKTFRYELTKTATGTSGSMLNISMDKLRDLLIWLPPLALQQQFSAIIERIEQQKAVVQQQIGASESLFQRLLQDSFGS